MTVPRQLGQRYLWYRAVQLLGVTAQHMGFLVRVFHLRA